MSGQQGWFRRSLTAGGLAAVFAAVPMGALVHEEGTLKVADRSFVPGSTVQIGGEKFSRGGKLDLVLVGVAGRFVVGEVTADSAGGFSASFEVPMDVAVGAYRLVAIATDGDEVATVNVNMLAAPAAPEDHGQSEDHGGAEPSAEPLLLDRAHSPFVRGGAIVGIVLALAAGGMLLRKPHG